MHRVVPFAPPRSGVDLAFEPDFSLGAALVRPSRHEVLIGDRCEIVEPRVMQVLVALGQSPGETVTRDELIRRCWDGRFVSDDAINRTISKIRSIAQLDGGASFRIETRPRLGYRLFESDRPAAEMQPPGRLSRGAGTGEDDPGEAETSLAAAQPVGRGKRVLQALAVTIAAALIGVVAYLLLRGGDSPPKAGDRTQLRLAAFDRLGPDVPPSLALSLREEVLAAFGEDDVVVVRSGNGTQRTGTHSFVLSGTVRRVDDRLRFTLQLENEQSGALLLTETIDRPAALPAIAPRQAAVSMSQVVRCGLSGIAPYRGPLPDSTLALYFQFCQETWAGREDHSRALHTARRVSEAAPDFSGGWSGVAASIGYLVRNGPDIEQLRSEGLQAASRAISLDPKNPEGWLGRALLLPALAYAETEETHRRSITVNPSDCGCAHQFYGHFLASNGRTREAIVYYRRAREMQPLVPSANQSLAMGLSTAGETAEAIAILDRTIGLWPGKNYLLKTRVRAALSGRRYREGLRLLGEPDLELASEERAAWRAALVALTSNDPAQRDAAAGALERVTRDPSRNDPFPVMALGALGRNADALMVAERIIKRRGPSAMRVLFEPPLAQARREPAFAKLIEGLGLGSYWRKSGHKPDFCMAADAPGFCRSLG